MSEDKIINNWIREPKTLARMYEFYICGAIESPECYIDMYDVIRHSGPEDVVKIYLNSYGGDLFAAIQFLRVISETEATVIVSIEGAAMSAATLLFLAADSVEITPNSSIMIHHYSSGLMGKGNEMLSQVQHEAAWSKALFSDVYQHFLTDEEIEAVLAGKDIWLDSEDVMSRMQKRADTIQELIELDKATRPD